MKRYVIFSAGLAVFLLTGASPNSAPPARSQQVNERIQQLRKEIDPPVGTRKADVDAVYGEPKEIPELPPHGKGSAADYPVHCYDLLPVGSVKGVETEPRVTNYFRAMLLVSYREGKVWRANINHMAEIKGPPLFTPGSPEALRQQREIEAENRLVLIDLEEIRTKYADKLKNASWNKAK